jgi:hypothetical protein
MSEQFDRMSEQPNEGLTTEDIVSARRRKDIEPEPDMGRSGTGTPAESQSGGARMSGAAPTRLSGQPARGDAQQPVPLLTDDAADAYQARWDEIQAAFVDEPRWVVEQADSLVAEVMQRLAESFAHERASLERQWALGGDVSTEELRLALQRYRSFFQRLLSA